MNRLTFTRLDFSEINAYLNERDLELWQRQAIAKYCKIKYEEFHKENENLDGEIKRCEEKIKKIESKLPMVKELVEREANSRTIASVALTHLFPRTIEIEKEISSETERYEKMIAKYLSLYEDERKILEQESVLYGEFNEARNTVEGLNIKRNILRQSDEDLKRMINTKIDINRKLINSNVVAFVRAVTYSKQLSLINEEIKEKKIIAQNSLKEYERDQLNIVTSYPGSRNMIEQSELPKCSLQVKRAPQLINFNIPKFPSSAASRPRQDDKPKINEINLLNELKQRSEERRKIIQQRNALLVVPQKQRKPPQETPSNRINSVCSNAAANNNAPTSSSQSNLGEKEPVRVPPKVKVLQNEVISAPEELPSKVRVAEKRSTSGELNADTKAKKAKKVSFGEHVRQEQVIKPSVNNSEHKTAETSSYFTKPNSTNTTSQMEFSFLDTTGRYMPSEDFSIEGDTADVAEDFMNSKDETFFSASNNNDQNELYWSQSSQPSLGFGLF